MHVHRHMRMHSMHEWIDWCIVCACTQCTSSSIFLVALYMSCGTGGDREDLESLFVPAVRQSVPGTWLCPDTPNETQAWLDLLNV